MERVLLANELYGASADIAEQCARSRTFFAIENPTNSLMWSTEPMRRVQALPGVVDVHYQACMFGGKRSKRKTLRTNLHSLTKMAVMCDDSHSHLGWGYDSSNNRWATTLEAEYPVQFCKELASVVAAAATQHGIVLNPSSLTEAVENGKQLNRSSF